MLGFGDLVAPPLGALGAGEEIQAERPSGWWFGERAGAKVSTYKGFWEICLCFLGVLGDLFVFSRGFGRFQDLFLPFRDVLRSFLGGFWLVRGRFWASSSR